MTKEVLIIDDKVKLCKSLAMNFEEFDYTARYSTNGADALNELRAHPISVVLLDLSLGDESGIDILQSILKLKPGLPVIMITGYATLETAVEAIKLGAIDFLEKPLKFDKLFTVVENAIKLASLEKENSKLKTRISSLTPKITMVSNQMEKIYKRAEKLAKSDIPVLIYGESGTGKELLAKFIHNNSPRAANELIQVNSAALHDNLIDSELFGHEKGSFTGADKKYIGVFEQASESTLHLDEVGDMTLATQAKILRALENKEIKRVGGNRAINVDFRFITSTNKDLKELMAENLFREDLYFRLTSAVLTLPPLRDRAEDIPLLTSEFLSDFASSNNTDCIKVDDDVMSALKAYKWPGNIRELKNTINYMATVCCDDTITIDDLPHSFAEIAPQQQNGTLEETEKQQIIRTLRQTGNNKKKTAEILNISRKTLYNKLEKYGLN